MDWQKKYQNRIISAAQAAAMVNSGDTLAVNVVDNIPYLIMDALADELDRGLTDITVNGMALARKPMRILDPVYADRVRFVNFFWGGIERKAAAAGAKISYQPIHLHARRADALYGRKTRIYMTAVSAPDENGLVSTAPVPVDADTLSMYDIVIVQVNEKLPYICGNRSKISLDDVDFIVDGPENIIQTPSSQPGETEQKIASFVAERIPDGACVQLGIGGLGNAIGGCIKDKRHLGIHSELFVDAYVDLIECGAADNSRKNICPGKSEFGFTILNDRIAKLLDNNSEIEAAPFSWINDPRVICQIDNMISINSAMEADVTGQIAAEGIGSKHHSGTGGQVDFIRGARWSKGGKSFICLPSSFKDKEGNLHSKISVNFAPGTPVTTPRADVQYLVTEYGIADLEFCSLSERAEKIISIAHPAFREELTYQAKKAGIFA